MQLVLSHLTLLAILCYSLFLRVSKGQGLGPTQTGVASFYGGPQDNTSPNVASFGLLNGACGYGQLQQNEWPFWQATAISPSNPLYAGGNKKGCGACIQATCTSGCMANATPLVVLVTDTCNDCAATQLNIHSLAFQSHFNNDLAVGQVNVQWQQVACTPPSDIRARVVDYRVGSGGFIAVSLLSVAGNGVISGLEIQSLGQSNWLPMVNDYGAVWQASNLGSVPFSLRITGSAQQQLTATGAITEFANGTYPTGVQFGGFQSSAAAPPAQQSAAVSQSDSSTAPPVADLPNAQLPPAAATSNPLLVSAPPPAVASSPPPTVFGPPPVPTMNLPVSAPESAVQALQLTPAETPATEEGSPQIGLLSGSQSPGSTPPSLSLPAPTAAPVLPALETTPAPSMGQPTVTPLETGTAAPTQAPRPASRTASAPTPSRTTRRAPAPAPRPATRSAAAPQAPSQSAPSAPDADSPALLAASPATTQLMLNTSLGGAAARAGDSILNPAITVSAGRRLRSLDSGTRRGG